MNESWDLVVVGAGMAGASLVAQLPGRLDRVLLIERESQPGYHATGRSAAVFAPFYGPPSVRALTRASRAFLLAPPAGFASAPLLQPRGALMVALAEQATLLEAPQDDGAAMKRLSPAEASARLPVLRAEALAGAWLDDDVADIDVHALHQGFLRTARAQGAAVRCGVELVEARREGEGWTLRVQGAGPSTLHCRRIANAAGAWGDEVARRCGVAPLGLQPRRRSACMLDLPPGTDTRRWPMAVALDETWYLKPETGRVMVSPANADPVQPQDVQPEELDIALAMDRIGRVTTLGARRPRQPWAGLRSFLPDGEPAAGFDGEQPAFFWLVGQGGYGIQTAPMLGLAAASLLTDRPWPEALAAEGLEAALLSPGRLRRTEPHS